jgi:hypothetical protein
MIADDFASIARRMDRSEEPNTTASLLALCSEFHAQHFAATNQPNDGSMSLALAKRDAIAAEIMAIPAVTLEECRGKAGVALILLAENNDDEGGNDIRTALAALRDLLA